MKYKVVIIMENNDLLKSLKKSQILWELYHIGYTSNIMRGAIL